MNKSKYRQIFNNIKIKLPITNYTKESSNQKILTDNTSEHSTVTKGSSGWGAHSAR
ncbi:MAG: hypothetical protein ACR5KW_01975 [Wolbachia sp.]